MCVFQDAVRIYIVVGGLARDVYMLCVCVGHPPLSPPQMLTYGSYQYTCKYFDVDKVQYSMDKMQ